MAGEVAATERELAFAGAARQAEMVRAGEVSPIELVRLCLERISRLDPQLNAFRVVLAERALLEAEQAEARLKAGEERPLLGVPIALKDEVDLAGELNTHGTDAFPDRATVDSEMVRRLREAGAIVVGLTLLPELAICGFTESATWGVTRNPWDPQRSPGGSSGGSGAAVASGLVPIASASDGGGSIRIPAACCGLFGLKPSRGRIVQEDPAVAVTDLGVELAVSRSVRDSALLFALAENLGPLKPVGLVMSPSLRRLKVGLVMDTAVGRRPDADVTAAIQSTAELLQELGHTVTPAQWPIHGERFAQDFLTLWALGAQEVLKDAGDPNVLEPFTVELVRQLTLLPADALGGLTGRLEEVARQYDSWFERFDLILSPVLAHPPVPLGYLRGDVPFEDLRERLTDYVGYTPLNNVAGAPAMSVPLWWTPGGLPVGSHFSARRGDERTLFELAYELEQARPWAQRRPPVSVS